MVDRLGKFTYHTLLITLFVMPFSMSLNEIFSGLTLLAWVLLLLRRREFPRVPPLGWLLLLFLSAAMASAAASDYRGQALKGVWDIIRSTAVFLIVADIVKSDGRIKKVCWVLIVSTALWIAAGSIYQFLLLKRQPFQELKIFALGNKNAVGQYLEMVLALTAGLWINKSLGSRYRALLGVLILVFLGGLFLSSSKTMWVTFVLTAVLFALLTRSRILFIGLGCILVAFLGAASVDKRVQTMSSHITKSVEAPSMQERYVVWKQSYGMFAGNPVLGVGPKCFFDARDRYKIGERYGQAHNIILHTACEMGIVGVAALLPWIIFYIYFLSTYRSKVKGPLYLGLWFGGVAYLVTLVIGGITEPTIGGEHSQLFMTVVGLMYAGIAARSPGA